MTNSKTACEKAIKIEQDFACIVNNEEYLRCDEARSKSKERQKVNILENATEVT